MIDFLTAKSIIIPEGEVSVISRGSEILWRKQKYKRELLYLESTGTQWIDTGVILSNNHSVEIDYQLTVDKQYRTGLFGNLTTKATARYGTIFSPSNAYMEYGYGAGNIYYQMGVPDTDRHLLKQEKNKVYVDGALIYTFAEATFTIGSSAPLGNFGYTKYTPAKARYYGSRWWDCDNLVRDFIPVLDIDDVPCMYDKVSGELFYNRGAGKFLYGELTKYKTTLEYIEGTGAQWIDIDTAINTATDTVELVFQNTENNIYKWLFGEHDNNARFGLGSGDGVNKRNVAYGGNTYKVQDSQLYNSQHTFAANVNGVFIDNAKIANFASFASSSTLYLFNLNLSGGNYAAAAKVWSYKQTRDGVLIRDLIPVLDWSDKPCLYDKVTDELFYNACTGEFLYA